MNVDLTIKEIKTYNILNMNFESLRGAEHFKREIENNIRIIEEANVKLKRVNEWSVKFYFYGNLIMWKSEDYGSSFYLFNVDETGFYQLEYLLEDRDTYSLCLYPSKGETLKDLEDKFKEKLMYCDLLKLKRKLKLLGRLNK